MERLSTFDAGRKENTMAASAWAGVFSASAAATFLFVVTAFQCSDHYLGRGSAGTEPAFCFAPGTRLPQRRGASAAAAAPAGPALDIPVDEELVDKPALQPDPEQVCGLPMIFHDAVSTFSPASP